MREVWAFHQKMLAQHKFESEIVRKVLDLNVAPTPQPEPEVCELGLEDLLLADPSPEGDD